MGALFSEIHVVVRCNRSYTIGIDLAVEALDDGDIVHVTSVDMVVCLVGV